LGLLGSIIGGVTSIIGGNAQKKAAKKAAAAQVEAARLGIEEQRRQFDATRADFAPYLGAGTTALGDISDILGLNGADAQTASLGMIENSPIFSALTKSGEDAILQNASATGGVRGGNTQGVLARFRPELLDSLVQRQLSSLGGLANMGMGSAGQVGQFGANASTNIANLIGQQGQARAGSALVRGGVNAMNWQNAGDALSGALESIFSGGLPSIGGRSGGSPVIAMGGGASSYVQPSGAEVNFLNSLGINPSSILF